MDNNPSQDINRTEYNPTNTNQHATNITQDNENPTTSNDRINTEITQTAISIISWNANSLTAHAAQLKLYIQNTKIKPDIICIQESWLKQSSNFKIQGYSTELKSRVEQAGGGVAIFIKEGVLYERIEIIPPDIEGIAIQIHAHNRNIQIINIYIPPKPKSADDQYELLTPLFSASNTIIVGDFNAKNQLWGSMQNDRHGDKMEELIGTDMVVLNDGTGTRINNDGSRSHLDLSIASKDLSAKCNWYVMEDSWNSDHLPTITTIFETPEIETNNRQQFDFNKGSWALFDEICRQEINSSLLHPQIDIASENITEAILKAARGSIPMKKLGRAKMVPYWNEACSNAIKEKRRAQKKMERSKDLMDCIEYRRRKAIAQRTIKDAEKEHWQEYCSSINKETKLAEVWRRVKGMNGGGKAKSTIPTLKHDQGSYISNQDKADAFSRHFAQSSSSENHEQAFLQKKKSMKLKATPPDHLSTNPINDPFSLFELQHAISQSKKNSSPGEDGISYEIIQKLPKPSQIVLLELYNRMWSQGEIPGKWKHSIVFPIHKPGKDATKVDSYRPIALTDALCKINERLIASRLSWFMESSKLFNTNQAGFRKNKSCIDQIMRLQSDIENALNQNKYTVGIFLDFSKAYDMLWIDGLLHKMIQLGIGGNAFRWIKSFLTQRTFQVKIGDAMSETRTIENGTPQGSVISPLLFLIMINDLPTTTNGVSMAIFADDTSMWKTGWRLDEVIRHIQVNLDKVREWCNTWGFILSKEKTVPIIFTHRYPASPTKLTIDKVKLDWKKEVKFLGLIFDSRLTWNKHIDYVAKRCTQRLNLMKCMSGQRWGANKQSLVHTYIAMIRSIIDYGASAYFTAHPSRLARLNSIQCQALRISCGAMKSTPLAALQVECGDPPFELRYGGCQLKYAMKVKHTEGHPASVINKAVPTMDKSKTSFAKRTGEFIGGIQRSIEGPKVTPFQPWRRRRALIDTDLQGKIDKKMDPEVTRRESLEAMAKYQQQTQCFTDGSAANGRVGAAFCIPQLDIQRNFRLPDDVTIYTAELTAIRELLKFIKLEKLRNIVVFSDSLSAILSIRSENSNTRPNMISEILLLISDIILNSDTEVSICWIPSHVGLPGNDTADALARAALEEPEVGLDVALELKETYAIIEKHTMNKWQDKWNSEKTGRHFYGIVPKVSKKIKFTSSTRAKDTMITRLRTGHCCLNQHLFKIHCHATGLCNECGVPETVEHFLLSCTANSQLSTAISDTCRRKKIPPDIAHILSHKSTIEVIFHHVSSIGRKI